MSPAVPMAKSVPTPAAGSATLGSLVMPGKATDNTTHVLISAWRSNIARFFVAHMQCTAELESWPEVSSAAALSRKQSCLSPLAVTTS